VSNKIDISAILALSIHHLPVRIFSLYTLLKM